ncbi:hypothetical protein [Flavobacterium sp. IMCC34518]|uniref:hypothetical protein n=1 Tax=Flavobacterium sp. IMCC34518 TaxID=3003623 RepID=UPI0022ABE759|nr:hypothetical protein [Flavobacterium sp. IMCC34518]
MEQLTTYRAKGKEIGLVFLFKYDLNGNLKLFEISEGELNEEQIKWLFSHFPATESIMKTIWMRDKKYKKVFEVEKSPADLCFEALWKLYDHKIAKFHAEKAFEKLKEESVIKCFLSIPIYKKYLAHSKIAQAHLATYINGRYYENEYK